MNFTLLLRDKKVLFILLVVNIIGSLYGFIWYGGQLSITPNKYLIFVPDSPTASLFFVFVLIGLILRTNLPLFEALAIVTLFKYGIWAVVMNVLVLIEIGYLDWSSYMLIFSHGAMAIQGLLYKSFYKIKGWHLVVAAIWTLHNDVIDYLFNMMPRYSVLDNYIPQIGYFTFWLSVISIGITYFLCIRKKKAIPEI
ncbi:DUF1405 domain-containing protein [Niallia sp. FSL R7-0271]|uniref:DUF1405 domain-containing protein n=1 Tax=Niallia sp. FSL R7-0271 TaxID=2921678 RepID=UPI0030F71A27